MNLILQAIKSLFRKQENSISNLQAANKKIDDKIVRLRKSVYKYLYSIEDWIMWLEDYTNENVTELREYTDDKVVELKEYTDDKVVELKEYTDDKVVEYTDSKAAELKEYTDDKVVELREYMINTYHTFADLLINVTMYDSSAIPSDVYITVYDLDRDTIYAHEQFNGKPIIVKLPTNFNYSISITEIDGFIAETYTGTATSDIELLFTYRLPAIYGVEWDKTSTTKLSRTNDAALFEDPVPYVAGATSYGSPFDRCVPWSVINIVEDPTAGTLVAIPKYWFRWTDADGMLKLEIANYAAEGFSVSPAHRDRGDGKGERDVVYIGRYHCSINNYKSETGVKPKASMTRANFRTNIHNLGDTIYQNDFAMFWTIRMLYLVEYADWNSQEVIGYGGGNGMNKGSDVMGYTDSMPYHTGTTQSSRTTYGLGTQYRYIEGLWDNVCDWCDGIYFSGTTAYAIMNPNNFSDTTGGTSVGSRPTSSSYITSWGISIKNGFDWFLYPATTGGSSSTYISDNCYFTSNSAVLYVGGSYYNGNAYGIFYLCGYNASFTYANVGSRLMVLL